MRPPYRSLVTVVDAVDRQSFSNCTITRCCYSSRNHRFIESVKSTKNKKQMTSSLAGKKEIFLLRDSSAGSKFLNKKFIVKQDDLRKAENTKTPDSIFSSNPKFSSYQAKKSTVNDRNTPLKRLRRFPPAEEKKPKFKSTSMLPSHVRLKNVQSLIGKTSTASQYRVSAAQPRIKQETNKVLLQDRSRSSINDRFNLSSLCLPHSNRSRSRKVINNLKKNSIKYREMLQHHKLSLLNQESKFYSVNNKRKISQVVNNNNNRRQNGTFDFTRHLGDRQSQSFASQSNNNKHFKGYAYHQSDRWSRIPFYQNQRERGYYRPSSKSSYKFRGNYYKSTANRSQHLNKHQFFRYNRGGILAEKSFHGKDRYQFSPSEQPWEFRPKNFKFSKNRRRFQKFFQKRLQRGRRWRTCKKRPKWRKRNKRHRYIRLIFRRLFWYPSQRRKRLKFVTKAKSLPRKWTRIKKKFTLKDYMRFNRRKFRFRSKISLRYYWMDRYALWTQRQAYLRTLHFKRARRGLLRFMAQEEMSLKRFVKVWGLIPRQYQHLLKTTTAIVGGMIWVNFKPMYKSSYVLKPGDCVFFLRSRFRKFLMAYRLGNQSSYLLKYGRYLWRWAMRRPTRGKSVWPYRRLHFNKEWHRVLYRKTMRLLTTKHRRGFTTLGIRRGKRFRIPLYIKQPITYNWGARQEQLIKKFLRLRAIKYTGRQPWRRHIWVTRGYWKRLKAKYFLIRRAVCMEKVQGWSTYLSRYCTFIEVSRRLKIIVLLNSYTWAVHLLASYVKQSVVVANYHVQNWFVNTRFF